MTETYRYAPVDFNKVWQAGTPDAFRIIEDNGTLRPPVSSSVYHDVTIQFIIPNALGEYTVIRNVAYYHVTSGRYIRDHYKFNLFFDGEKYNGTYGDRKIIDQWYHGPLLRKIYDLWNKMMSRVYNCNDPSFQISRTRQVSVYYRWHIGELFIADLPTIPGFNEWANNNIPYKMALDKDMLNPSEGPIEYGPGKVAFVTFSENSVESCFRNNKNMGVFFDKKSKNYLVTVNGKNYGMFYDKDAAMNQYNYVAKAQGRDPQFLHPDQKMSIRETLNFKKMRLAHNGKKQLYTVIDTPGKGVNNA